MSLMFSSVALNAASVTAMFRDLFRNLMKWMTAFSSFFVALALRFTWKNKHLVHFMHNVWLHAVWLMGKICNNVINICSHHRVTLRTYSWSRQSVEISCYSCDVVEQLWLGCRLIIRSCSWQAAQMFQQFWDLHGLYNTAPTQHC